jgi:hypothetical protein
MCAYMHICTVIKPSTTDLYDEGINISGNKVHIIAENIFRIYTVYIIGNVGPLTSHNPIGLHGLLEG